MNQADQGSTGHLRQQRLEPDTGLDVQQFRGRQQKALLLLSRRVE